MKMYFGVVLLVALFMFAGLAGFAEKAQQTQAEAQTKGHSDRFENAGLRR